MDPFALQLLMDRFDKVDEDNKEIKTALTKHVEDDDVVHTVVLQHMTYWKLALAVATGLAATGVSIAVAFIR